MSDRIERRGSVAGRLAADTRLLVVEDERDIADFLRAYFRASGYDLVHVDPDSPGDVVAAAREQRPDCVLLDVRLRGFSGIDAYRLMRADRGFAFVPVILVTADTSAPVKAVGVADGIDGYVAKPFSVHALEDVVADRIRRARDLRGQTGDGPLATTDQLRAQLVDQVRAAELGGSAVSYAIVRLVARAEVGGGGPDVARAAFAEEAEVRAPADAVVGSTGGDELAAVLPGLRPADAAELVAAIVDRCCRGLRLPGGAPVTVEAHAGVAGFPDHAATAEQLEMAADAALADAVDSGEVVVVAR